MAVVGHEVPEARAWGVQCITDPTALLRLSMDDAEIVRTAVLENLNCSDEIRVAVALQQ